MDYNKVKTFLAVAEYASITKAATQMRRSQSAVSQQIQLLEEELGLKLLERKAGKIFLSRHGEAIVNLAEGPLRQLDEGIIGLRHELSQVEGQLKIGILNDYGNQINYGKIVGDFVQSHAKVSIALVEGTSESLEKMLLANQIDLSFQVYYQAPEMFKTLPIVKNCHSLYAAPSYIKAKGPFKTYKDVIDADLIDLTPDFICLGTFFKKNAPKLAPSLQHRLPSVAAPNHDVVKSIVVSGFGIAILPDYFVAPELKKKKVVSVLPKAKSVFAGLDLAYRTNKTLRLCEQVFVDYIRGLP